jgi:hypothetical protein
MQTPTTSKPPRPVAIRIINLDYDILWRNRVWYEDTKCFGRCDNNEQEIEIYEDLKPSKMADTFLHEVMHAVYCNMGLTGKRRREETVVNQLATGLTNVWRDNPAVFAWWAALLSGGGR